MTDNGRSKNFSDNIQLLLANERTLLAWIRTGLAVQAGGIALTAFYKDSPFPGLAILILGIAIALIGHHRYKKADKYIRDGKLPPSDATVSLQIYAITIIVLGVVVLQVSLFNN